MPSKGSETKNPKKLKGSPLGSEKLVQAFAVPSSPDKSDVVAWGEPSGLFGAAASLSPAAPVYITEDVFASALEGVEERLMALIASYLPERKHGRSSSLPSGPLAAEQLSPEEIDFFFFHLGDQAEGHSDVSPSKESTAEEHFSASD